MTTPAPVPAANGAKPTGQAPGPTPTPPAQNGAPATPPEAPKPPEGDARLKELEAQTKRFAAQQRKFSEEKAAREKDWAEKSSKMKEYEEWQQYRADRLRNPAKYLEKDYGPDWYDKLTGVKMNGAPTGDLIASELDERLSGFQKKLDEREAVLNKRFEELQQKENERAKEAFYADVVAQVRKNLDKYPGLAAFEDDATVWKSVTEEIDKHYQENHEAINAGEMELLTPDAAASKVNKRIEALAERFETAKAKRQPAATQPPQSETQRRDTPQRRTLSTDMTASSGTEWTPPKDDKERFQRAAAAMERAKQRGAP